MNQVQKSFYTHYRRKNIKTLPEELIKLFCQLIAKTYQRAHLIQSNLLKSVIRSNLSISDFLVAFKEFILYLSHPEVDSDAYNVTVAGLELKIKKLRLLRQFISELLRDQKDLKQIDRLLVRILPDLVVNFNTSGLTNYQKYYLAQQSYLFFRFNQKWLVQKCQQYSIKPDTSKAVVQPENALKELYIKEIEAHAHREGKQKLEQLNWIYQNSYKDLQMDFDTRQKIFLESWNKSLPELSVNIYNFWYFFSKVFDKIVQEEINKHKLHNQISEYLKKCSELRISIFVNCFSIFVWVYRGRTNNLMILKNLQIDEILIWKTIPTLATSDSLNLPYSLKIYLFFYEQEILLLNLTVQKYLTLHSNYDEPSIVQQTFIDRLQQHLSYRFEKFNQICNNIKLTFYYKKVLSCKNLATQPFKHVLVDQILLCSIYCGFKLFNKGQISFLELLQHYDKLKTGNKDIRIVNADQQKNIIDFYNQNFLKSVIDKNDRTIEEETNVAMTKQFCHMLQIYDKHL